MGAVDFTLGIPQSKVAETNIDEPGEGLGDKLGGIFEIFWPLCASLTLQMTQNVSQYSIQVLLFK